MKHLLKTGIAVENLCATLPKRETYMQDINGPSSPGVKSDINKSSDEEPMHKALLVLRNLD